MGRGHPFCNSPQKIKLRPLALQPTAHLHLPAVGGAGGQRKEPTAPAGSHRLFLCKTTSPVRELQHTGHCLTPRATEQNPSFVTIALDPRRPTPPGVSFQRLQLHKTMSFLFNYIDPTKSCFPHPTNEIVPTPNRLLYKTGIAFLRQICFNKSTTTGCLRQQAEIRLPLPGPAT